MSNPFPSNPFGGGPYPPRQPPRPPAPPGDEVNVLATLSVVFAFVFAPAGVLFGHLGLAQIRRTGERGRDRALIGTTLSYVFLTVAVVASVVGTTLSGSPPARVSTSATTTTATPTTTTTTATSPLPPTVAPANADGLLPSLDDVENITGDHTMTVKRTLHKPTPAERGQLERPECWPVEESSAPEAYDGSAFTAFSALEIVDNHDVYHQWETGQGVAAYHDATQAQALLTKLRSVFGQCGGSTIKATWPNGKSWPMSITAPADAGNGITVVQLLAQTPIRVSCTHAVAARANVVVDVETCSTAPTADQSQQASVAITNLILGKIPG